jgi:hypothetical protein
MVGCPQNILLEEVTKKIKEDKNDESDSTTVNASTKSTPKTKSNNSTDSSVVEQILKLAEFKEKGMLSEEEFEFIKKELINKLK